MIRHLLIDIDDTLLDFGAQERDALCGTFRSFGVPDDEQTLTRYRQINLEQWQRHDAGLISRDEVLYGRFARLFAELQLDVSPRQMEDTYRDRLSRSAVPVPGALEALADLAAHYALYIVTNGLVETQASRLEHAGMLHYFREVFVSDELGAHKPEPEFFTRCFARIPDFSPAHTMIIGDNLTADILGGKQAGLQTCWFNYHRQAPDPAICPDYTITGWHQIHTIL